MIGRAGRRAAALTASAVIVLAAGCSARETGQGEQPSGSRTTAPFTGSPTVGAPTGSRSPDTGASAGSRGSSAMSSASTVVATSSAPPSITLPTDRPGSDQPTAATTAGAPASDRWSSATTTRSSNPPPPTPSPPQPSVASVPAPFRSSVHRIDPALAAHMSTSYHDGCPVPLSELRYLTMTYLGFDGRPHTGELVVSARVAADVVTVFHTLYEHRFPIRQMRLVDDFGGSDDASMEADNTSAFNCRPVTGGGGWSEHSYGEAIDVDPLENPYLSGDTVLPSGGAAYLDRPNAPGVIHPGDVVVSAFAAIGWTWGGTWSSPVDLQHFSRSGH